jgi:hypothetical protein
MEERSREGAKARRNGMWRSCRHWSSMRHFAFTRKLTYLRLLNLPLGLLINFGAAMFKDEIKRIVNNHTTFAPSREPGASGMRFHFEADHDDQSSAILEQHGLGNVRSL